MVYKYDPPSDNALSLVRKVKEYAACAEAAMRRQDLDEAMRIAFEGVATARMLIEGKDRSEDRVMEVFGETWALFKVLLTVADLTSGGDGHQMVMRTRTAQVLYACPSSPLEFFSKLYDLTLQVLQRRLMRTQDQRQVGLG